MHAHDRFLPEWFNRIRSRQITLPRFQRFMAWGHGEVSGLLTTVLRGLPSGATLILEVGDEEKFKSRTMVDAPESAVSVALGNLIGNAVKYTQHGEVVVRLHDAAVDVIDSGPGLSAEDAAKLFQRGYRGTHAGHSQGGGIGLSIVRRLCALYGWDVQVRPGAERGVIATLTLERGTPTTLG